MADYGLKVSSGVNVLQAQEKDIFFASNRNLLKTHRVGLSTAAQSFAHGLSYIPIFFTSVQSTDNTGTIIGNDRNTSCDIDNFNIGATTKYYLFYQAGS